MIRPAPRLAAFAALLLTAACASAGPGRTPTPTPTQLSTDPQTRDLQIAALRTGEAQGRRLARVGERVLFAGAPLCGDRVVPATGLVLWNAYSAGPGWPALLAAVFRIDGAVRIRAVGDRTPAAEAGLRPGDTLTEIEGRPVGVGRDAVRAAVAALRRLNTAGQPYRITIRRAATPTLTTPATAGPTTANPATTGPATDSPITVSLTPRRRCDYAYRLAQSRGVNAWTDGTTITVTRGMIRFAETDTELATIFGHELAHNVRRHLTKSRVNSVAASTGGMVVDIVLGSIGIPTFGVFATVASAVGTRAYSKTWEREADRLGLYFVARAGYAVEKSPLLWRRLAAAYGGEGQFSSTHPSYAQRIADVVATVREIEAKRARGEPLIPDAQRRSRPAETR